MSRSFKLTIAYDGTDFAGWQVQPNQPTIQQKLQRAFLKVTGEEVQVIGSGRTDSGVHALGQVASCRVENWRAPAANLVRALNAHLPDTITVRDAVDAPDDFHAIRDAVRKRYRYQLQLSGLRDAFEFRYRWHVHGRYDLEVMQAAANRILGRHDFRSFQASGADPKITTTRTIFACDVIEQRLIKDGGRFVAIEIEADGFLYNMVRNIVGTLIEVGRGKRPDEWIDEVLEARDRNVAGQTAPPMGLFLLWVDYDGNDKVGQAENASSES